MKITGKTLSAVLTLVLSLTIIGSALTTEAQAKWKGTDGKKDKQQEGRFNQDGPRRNEGMMLQRLAKELNLTPEQQGEITKIMATFQQERQAKMEERMSARRDAMKQLTTGEFDETKVREAFQQMQSEREQSREQMQEDRFVERVKMMAALKAVLTPEQTQQLEEKMDKFFEEGGPRGKFDRGMSQRNGRRGNDNQEPRP